MGFNKERLFSAARLTSAYDLATDFPWGVSPAAETSTPRVSGPAGKTAKLICALVYTFIAIYDI